MKRIAIALIVGIGLLATLCIGLALAITFTPLRTQVSRVIEQVAQRAGIELNSREARETGRQQDNDRQRSFGSSPDFEPMMQNGALIGSVVSGSPAEQAGLQIGETITAVDGSAVALPEDLINVVQQHKPGDQITLSVEDSAGQQRDVTVTLGQKESSPQAWLGVSLSAAFEHSLPNGSGRSDGQNGQGGPMFEHMPNLPDGYTAGAVLMEVTAGSPAEKAGLQAGQVILAVDGQKATSADELKASIAANKPGDQITLTVSGPDDATTQEITITLGENPDQAGAAYLGIRFGFIQVRPETVPDGPGS